MLRVLSWILVPSQVEFFWLGNKERAMRQYVLATVISE
ncbi:hypothetical protein SAMN06296036_102380 [Pseudobacteriovorax antillogorgiicola]|uniref:Uncharacterized protein n=1 Tax=Pseudobacteriovorax antillogorgiicola TaxID=1513793 RepID=A0A1Y6B7Y8_9BACT|nr:hypothetical protein EDD56_10263 [Pseudobacteriovorax antillogorgiicola]SME97727.1 hypothetical protein SAMN06296036_102380 [Pseudobacteriovorax antillogorgiicola]